MSVEELFAKAEENPETDPKGKQLEKLLRESDERARELFERQDPNRPCPPPKESTRAARRPNR